MKSHRFKVVFIDDNLNELSPFVQGIRKSYEEIDGVCVYRNPDEGLRYVMSHLDDRMIVFIDWDFGSNRDKGIDLLKRIRSKTSLLYIVMMSANDINGNIPPESIVEMINEENIFYLHRSKDFDVVKSIVDKICRSWKTRFDCILEQWLVRHPEDGHTEAFSDVASGKVYTWAEILSELRKQSDVGKYFEGLLNEFYIHTFDGLRKKV